MTLLEFLTARYDEDAELGAEAMDPQYSGGGYGLALGKMLIADIEAKRRILELGDVVQREVDQLRGTAAASLAEARLSLLDLALRRLASPYSDHPDWREEWRP